MTNDKYQITKGSMVLSFELCHLSFYAMKILFMGTPEFALPSLEALAASEQYLCGVVTRPDRRSGRRLVPSPPPVKRRALELGLRVFQPDPIDSPAFINEVKALAPDLIAVVAYGSLLPRALWEMPPHGTINLHPSLLPRCRGAAPVQRAILDGLPETGVTVACVGERMDAGDIIAQEGERIFPEDTAETLGERLAKRGALLLLRAVRAIEKNETVRVPQNEAAATFAPKIRKSDGIIDWHAPAGEIARRVRAFQPWPGAYTHLFLGGRRVYLKILKAEADEGGRGEPGLIMRCNASGIRVGSGEGCLILKRLQPEGKRAMGADEFLRGHRDLEGLVLG